MGMEKVSNRGTSSVCQDAGNAAKMDMCVYTFVPLCVSLCACLLGVCVSVCVPLCMSICVCLCR